MSKQSNVSDAKLNTELPDDTEVGTGAESSFELTVSNRIASAIHLFLIILATLLLVSSAVATFETVNRHFPALWQPNDEYSSLAKVLDTLLLIAIAAEFALLLLFRRLSAAVEVVVFVLARKTINPEIQAYELLLCAVGIAGLIIIRFYYLPGRTT